MTRPSPRLALLAWLALLAALGVPSVPGPPRPRRPEPPAALPVQRPAVDSFLSGPTLEVTELVPLQPIPVLSPVQTLLPEPSDHTPVRVTSFKPIDDCPKPVAEALRFSHAPHYGWLIGQLEYVYVRNAWKLHYAAAVDADTHGGSVTLVDTGPLTESLHGRLVRIEGRFLDVDGTDPCPAYEVHFLQLLSLP
jgi:hypothetical protein